MIKKYFRLFIIAVTKCKLYNKERKGDTMKKIISMLVSVMLASIMVMPIHAESNGRKVGNVTTWALEKSLIL